MAGILYGIGVGPGDPELMTIKAVKLIKQADIIAYPCNKDGISIALQIAQDYLPKTAKTFGFYVPMNVDRQAANQAYDAAAETIAEHLDAGRNVACLCEGDAFFYGSFAYIFERLDDEYSTKIIPSMPAFVAASAALKIPMLIQNEDLQIIPATLDEAILIDKIRTGSNVAIYKVGRHFSKIRKIIDHLNLLPKANLVEYVSQSQQKVTCMVNTNEETRPYFSMIIINKR
ncbi:MAG: precorrin-2 C(20)-methyltransferase [Rhizobiales bacterium]|nr:precorrin-2 C(20)-methyltransferase [Hyphomicrobiales bacterium]NRB13593.1 precorrin-2 C(20)-methyltransferase [Hyphomicrobiales bacterium]